jgi:hypothetical protein
MHMLFLTHYFPPEVNAPASRTYENAKRWIKEGHQVTVITCTPNHPTGVVYPGYKNRLWQWDEKDGIRVLRVKTYLSANKGFAKRILNYVSYMFSAMVFCLRVGRVDIVVSTSPQFFCGLAGYFVSRIKRRPWVLEIRDLWPESIIAVGAVKSRTMIGMLQGLETWMYRKADRIVALTNAFKRHIVRSYIHNYQRRGPGAVPGTAQGKRLQKGTGTFGQIRGLLHRYPWHGPRFGYYLQNGGIAEG